MIFEPTPAPYAIDELKTHFDRLGYDVVWKFGTYLPTRRDVARREPVPDRGRAS